jgi:hypothetical protein
LKEEEHNEEIIGSDNEQVSKIYTVKRDDNDKSQGGFVSLVVCEETMIHPIMETLVDKDMWIEDTGATSHITYSRIGGVNHGNTMVKTREFVGESINPDLEMDIPVMYICDSSKEIKAELKYVQVNEKFNFDLFSVTQTLQKGYILKGDANLIILCKGNHKFKFDSVIWTQGEGGLCNTMQDFAGIQLILLKSTMWHMWY